MTKLEFAAHKSQLTGRRNQAYSGSIRAILHIVRVESLVDAIQENVGNEIVP